MTCNQEARMKKRKQYPREFKARIALEAIKEQKTIAELSSEYEIHSTMITKWKNTCRTILQIFSFERMSKSRTTSS